MSFSKKNGKRSMRSMTVTVPIVDELSTSRICKSIISSRNVHGTPKTQGRTIFPTLCRHAECATTTSGQILWKRSGAISRKFPESSEKTTSTRWELLTATLSSMRNRSRFTLNRWRARRMATKRVCDRCGAEINPTSSATYVNVRSTFRGESPDIELCCSCAMQIKEWLKSRVEEGKKDG